MKEPNLEQLISEQALKDWYDVITIRTQLALLRSTTTEGHAYLDQEEERRRLLENYQEIRNRQNYDDLPQVVIGPGAYGPSTCGTCLARPFTIAPWRTVNPSQSGTHGTIRPSTVVPQHGILGSGRI